MSKQEKRALFCFQDLLVTRRSWVEKIMRLVEELSTVVALYVVFRLWWMVVATQKKMDTMPTTLPVAEFHGSVRLVMTSRVEH